MIIAHREVISSAPAIASYYETEDLTTRWSKDYLPEFLNTDHTKTHLGGSVVSTCTYIYVGF